MSQQLLEILGAVERAEARLLSWGLVDGAFGEDELIDLMERQIDREQFAVDAEEVLDDLLERRLLVRVPDRPQFYRTRMAETVRLLARLRQLFPKHEHGGWRSAPRLVADFRFALQPRRYPTRDISVEAAVEQLRQLDGPSSATFSAAEAMLSNRGEGFELARFQVDASESILAGIHSGEAGGTMVSAGTGSGKTLA